ncbi:hypothetical protein GCM10027614_22740 [Micromonospora vulcania]
MDIAVGEGDSPLPQPDDVGVQVVGLQHQALERPGRHAGKPGDQRERGGGAARRDLHPASAVGAHRVVPDQLEPEHVDVEVAGPVLVGDGYGE